MPLIRTRPMQAPDTPALDSTPVPTPPTPPGRVRTRRSALVTLSAALILGALAASGALALRLTLGPLDVTPLARLAAPRMAHAAAPGAQLTLHAASLTWDRAATPPCLRATVQGAVLTSPAGRTLLRAALLQLGVAPRALLTGHMHPLSLALTHATLALTRGRDGAITLAGAPRSPQPNASHGRPTTLPAQIRLDHVDATITDAASGIAATVDIAHATLAQAASNAARQGQLDATVTLAGQQTRIVASLHPDLTLDLGWTAVTPARLPPPWAAGLAPFDLPLSGQLQARLDPSLQPRTVQLALTLGAGTLRLAQGAIPLAAGQLAVTFDLPAHQARLTAARIVLASSPDAAPAPVLTAQGQASWQGDPLQSPLQLRLQAQLDRMEVASLGQYWPQGLARGGRAWVTTNATAGTLTGLHFELGLILPSLRGSARPAPPPTITMVSAHAQVHDLTLTWLRPLPPLVHVEATLAMLTPDALDITVLHATQSPTDPTAPPLALGASTMRITGLALPDQSGAIALTLAGPVAQLVSLLRAPRLRLLATHPLDVGTPAGAVAAHITVRLPLVARVTIDDIAIAAAAHLTDLHLGGLIAGHDLDHGDVQLTAGNDGLSATGTAVLAGLPSSIAVALDFRRGPPAGVFARYQAAGTADAHALAAAGLPATLAEGTLTYTATLAEQRDGAGQARIHLDLRAAGLTLPAFGWRKPAGADTVGEAHVLLDHDRLAGIDQLSLIGPGVLLMGHAGRTPASSPGGASSFALDIDRLELGATRASGRLLFPSATDPALHATLHGPTIDLSSQVKPGPRAATPSRNTAAANTRQRQAQAATRKRGMPWTAALQFDHVLLAPGRQLADVTASATHDGALIRHALITGSAGAGRFRLAIGPDPHAGRALHAAAQDAGGLLRALDLTNALTGGTLEMNAAFDDTSPDHPLVGTMLMDRFQVTGAVALARLLQAMTLYGVVDALHGPGLAFTHLVAPFRFADDVLSLDASRAFSASLGVTAKGDIDLAAQRADLTGTIVPAYFFNTLLGRLPVLGRVFSPETGGGVLAATYSLNGAIADPAVKVNPLAALTPGFLRGIFGINELGINKTAAAPSAAPATPAATPAPHP